MKIIAATLSLSLMSAGAHANTLDFSKFSCAVYDQKIHESSSRPELQNLIDSMHLWLYGFASAKTNGSTLSGSEATEFARELGQQCHKTPKMMLSDAAVAALTEVRRKA